MLIRPACLALALLLAATARAEEPPKKSAERTSTERELVVDKDDYKLRLSLPTEEDVAAWKLPGFRIALGIGYGLMQGPPPSGNLSGLAFSVRPSMRLDDRWSLAATFSFAGGSDEFSGLRWSATVEPVFHPWRGLALSLGLGYGGLMVNRLVPATWNPEPRIQNITDEITSRTLSDKQALYACTGSAWSSLARAEYLFVVGPMFSTGPYAQANIQITHCAESIGNTDNETGQTIQLYQWWRQYGGSVGWWFSWR